MKKGNTKGKSDLALARKYYSLLEAMKQTPIRTKVMRT